MPSVASGMLRTRMKTRIRITTRRTVEDRGRVLNAFPSERRFPGVRTGPLPTETERDEGSVTPSRVTRVPRAVLAVQVTPPGVFL